MGGCIFRFGDGRGRGGGFCGGEDGCDDASFGVTEWIWGCSVIVDRIGSMDAGVIREEVVNGR